MNARTRILASDGADEAGPAERLRKLERVVFAQRWDIEGLTEQREALTSELAEARARIVALTAATPAPAPRSPSPGTIRQTLAAIAAASARTLAHGPLDPRAEALALVAAGVIDVDFYAAQGGGCSALDGALQYVTAGEAAGMLANALFEPRHYALAAQRAGLPPAAATGTRLAHYLAFGAPAGLAPAPQLDPAWCAAQAGEAAADAEFEPLGWYLREGRTRGLSPHPVLDVGAVAAADPVARWRLLGLAAVPAIAPLVDADWYLAHHPEIAAVRIDPLLHYLGVGDATGHSPNSLFEPDWYRAHAGGPPCRPGAALSHYVLYGRQSGASTHPWFDAGFYLRRNHDVRAGGFDPLLHMLRHGKAEQRAPHPLVDPRAGGAPHPLFDAAWYVAQVPEAAAWPAGAFDHFLRHGPDNLADPHPLFCTRFYLEQAGALAGGETALAHYAARQLEQPGERSGRIAPHPLFSPDHYLRTQPDVAAEQVDPLLHFLQRGGTGRERRAPHPLFDIARYADSTRQLVPPEQNLLVDYLLHWRDRPSPQPLFDAAYFRSQPGPARHDNPLADHLWSGRADPRAPHRLFDPRFYAAQIDLPNSWTRTLLEHYLGGGAPEDFLPHPALDGALVAAQLASRGERTLLEQYLDRQAWLDPNADLCRLGWRLHHGATEPRLRAAPGPAALAALCGAGGVGALRRQLAGRRAAPLPSCAPARIEGTLPERGMRAGRLAIYAAHRCTAALALHRHAILALRSAGFSVLWVDIGGDGGEAAPADAAMALAAQGPVTAWLTAARALGRRVSQYRQVLFASDRLVGPLLPSARMWSELAAAPGWWALGHADGAGAMVAADWFAVPGSRLARGTLAELVAEAHGDEAALERALDAALRQQGAAELFLPAARLAGWRDTLPARLHWAAALAAQPARLGPGTTKAQARDFAALAALRLAELAAIADPRPGLVWWPEELRCGLGFLRRDLLTLNPAGSPELALLPELLPRRALATLAALIGPTLPAGAAPAAPFRLSRAWLAAMAHG